MADETAEDFDERVARATRDARLAQDEAMSRILPIASLALTHSYATKSADPSAAGLLGQSARELVDRAQVYDAPDGERSMAKTVAAFNEIYGTTLTEVQGWQFMSLLKIVRGSQGKFKRDNFVDQAAYAALAGEAASKEKTA